MYKDKDKHFFPCSVCGAYSKDLFKTLYDYGVFSRRITALVCKNCGTVCLNPRWDEKRHEKDYQSEYYGSWLTGIAVDSGFDNNGKRLHGVKIFNDLQGYIAQDAKIIEIGCGEGYNLVVLKENGFSNLTGLEPSFDCCRRLRMYGIDCINGTLSPDLDVKVGRKYDCCILSGVLEHFVEPQNALNLINGMLEPDGVIFVSIPDYYRFEPYTQFIKYHTSYFGRVSLKMLLNNSGFIVDKYSETHREELELVARKSSKKVIPITTNVIEYKDAVSYLKRSKLRNIRAAIMAMLGIIIMTIMTEGAYLTTRRYLGKLRRRRSVKSKLIIKLLRKNHRFIY